MLLSLLIAFAGGGVPFGAPSQYDAFQAITDRMLEEVRESGDTIRELDTYYYSSFPYDVSLVKCVPRRNYRVVTDDGLTRRYPGHLCIIEIFRNADRPYRTTGFFRPTNGGWQYHGPVRDTTVPQISIFEADPIQDGFSTKPGALNYDGAPQDPFNEDYNPYRDLLDRSRNGQ